MHSGCSANRAQRRWPRWGNRGEKWGGNRQAVRKQPARRKEGSRPISRVLSWAAIHLGRTSPHASCDLPGSNRGPRVTAHGRMLPYLVLLRVGFTVPPRVATGAVRSYRTFSPLPPARRRARRSVFCGTFRGLTPPRYYLAPCPVEPGLSSPRGAEAAMRGATAWPTPDRHSSRTGRADAAYQRWPKIHWPRSERRGATTAPLPMVRTSQPCRAASA